METTSKPKPLWPIVVGGVFLLLIFVIVGKVLTTLSPAADPEDLARIEERTKAREALEAENHEKLGTYAWADKAKGTVQIPIEVAMKLTVDELKGRTPAAAGPINPAPAAQPDPAATDAAAPAPAEGATGGAEVAAPAPTPEPAL